MTSNDILSTTKKIFVPCLPLKQKFKNKNERVYISHCYNELLKLELFKTISLSSSTKLPQNI